jgi:CheY-like chemotaxis protein
MRELLRRLLVKHGWRVTTTGDGLSALQQIEAAEFDAVLADYQVPGPSGIRVLEHARLLNPESNLVLFGGYLDSDAKERARAIGAVTVRKGATESVALLLTALDES